MRENNAATIILHARARDQPTSHRAGQMRTTTVGPPESPAPRSGSRLRRTCFVPHTRKSDPLRHPPSPESTQNASVGGMAAPGRGSFGLNEMSPDA